MKAKLLNLNSSTKINSRKTNRFLKNIPKGNRDKLKKKQRLPKVILKRKEKDYGKKGMNTKDWIKNMHMLVKHFWTYKQKAGWLNRTKREGYSNLRQERRQL